MAAAQHIPGPWVVCYDHSDPDAARSLVTIRTAVGASLGYVGYVADEIACVYCANPLEFPDRAASARLIAAAPDLLEALQRAICFIDPDMPVAAHCRAVIAKVTGEPT